MGRDTATTQPGRTVEQDEAVQHGLRCGRPVRLQHRAPEPKDGVEPLVRVGAEGRRAVITVVATLEDAEHVRELSAHGGPELAGVVRGEDAELVAKTITGLWAGGEGGKGKGRWGDDGTRAGGGKRWGHGPTHFGDDLWEVLGTG